MTPGIGSATLCRMFGLGLPEILIIVLLVVVIFGARRLPEVGAGLGRAIKNFKAGVTGKDEIDVTPKKEEVTEGKGQP
ncbi:Sec-independent protein translocase protein TatA [Myxococcaceae bacterium]|nr:Sec-independent protein translocase protein TatA [Myxococcaceae bacterium]